MLSEIADIIMGQSPKAQDVNDAGDGLPLLNGPTEFGPAHPYPVQFTTNASKVCQQGDLLFCVRGSTTGRMNWADQPYAIGRGIAAIRHKKSSRMQPFLRAVIEHELRNLLAHATGSTFPNVSSAMLARVDWPNLGEGEQQNASDCLAILDQNINLLRNMNNTLAEIARAVFRAWFVDFEPVRAKAAGATSFRGMSQNLFDSLPTDLEKSAVGAIPTGWKTETLGHLVELRNERVKAGPGTATLPYVPIESIDARSIFLMQEKPGLEAQSSLVRIYPNDILFGAMRPYFHKVCISPFEGTTRTTVFVLMPRTAADLYFSLMVLSEDKTVEFATTSSVGSTIPYAKWEGVLEKMDIVLPPPPFREVFGECIAPLIERGMRTKAEVDALTSIRDTLLPKLISGDVAAPSLEALGIKAVGDGG